MFDSNYLSEANYQDEDFFQNVCYEEIDTKWKGYAEASGECAIHDFRLDEPDVFKAGSEALISNICPKLSIVEVDSSTGFKFELPETSIGIPTRKFDIEYSNCQKLIANMQAYLDCIEEFDFTFVKDDHLWRGKHLRGSCCLEVEIRLSHDPQTKLCTVALAKTEGEGLGGPSIDDLYCNLQAKFDPSFSSSSSSSSGNSSNKRARRALPLPSNMVNSLEPTEEQFLAGMQSILKMATAPSLESRLEAVRMICDCSSKSARYLELSAFRAAVMDVLNALITDESSQVRQHAVMAIASFAEIPSYQELILQGQMLPALFSLVENCPAHACACETAQIRRSSASVLSLLCQAHAYKVRTQLQQHHLRDVEGWIKFVVPTLVCPRTKALATAAANQLSEVELSAADAAAWHAELGNDALTSLIH